MGSKLITGIKWTAVERFSNQLIQLVLSIVLARLIGPEGYGVLAILLIFINVSQVFIESGLGSALVFKNKVSESDLRTTFVFNLITSLLFASVLWIFSSQIESFYNVEKLGLYLKVSSIVLIINSFIVIPTAKLQIDLIFKKLATSTLLANFISALIGIILAWKGFGVWALISQMLSKSLILAILLIFQTKWRPHFQFNWDSFKSLYKYGVNLFSSNLLTKITDEGIASFIAKFLTPFNLGIFSRSGQFAGFPNSFIGSLITTVAFPALAKEQDDKTRYNYIFTTALKLECFIVIPLYLWLAVESKPIILTLLSESWTDAIPVFQILCVGRILALLAITTEQNLNARGRTDLCLKQQVIKLITKIICIAIALPFGIIAVAVADAVQTILQFFITNAVATRVIGFKIIDQLKLLMPYLISAIIATLTATICNYFITHLYSQFIISSIIGASVYLFSILKVFKQKEAINLIKRFV